jgi:hypothetical protein
LCEKFEKLLGKSAKYLELDDSAVSNPVYLENPCEIGEFLEIVSIMLTDRYPKKLDHVLLIPIEKCKM